MTRNFSQGCKKMGIFALIIRCRMMRGQYDKSLYNKICINPGHLHRGR